MVYTSDETGSSQAFVQGFPTLGMKQQVSKTGAVFATWARSGREILLLPPVCIAAEFRSSPAGDPSMQASGLIIAWFQDHDSPILSEENRLRLADVDWDAFAVDFEY